MTTTCLPLRASFVATAALFAALSLPVGAQTAAPATPAVAESTAPSAQPGPSAERMQQRMQQRSENRAQRLAQFKAKLELSPEQEAAWTTYQEAMKMPRPTPPDMQKLRAMTTPERIDHMRQQREQHHAEADRRGEATKAFYAQLTPAQQKTFDAYALRGKKGHGPMHDKGRPGAQGGPGQCW